MMMRKKGRYMQVGRRVLDWRCMSWRCVIEGGDSLLPIGSLLYEPTGRPSWSGSLFVVRGGRVGRTSVISVWPWALMACS